MQRIKVISSNIQSVGYDVASHVLEIEFTTGATYQYFDVPEYIYEAMMNASSHGKYFYQNIRDNYRNQKI
jgi:hypothetical protein